MNIKDKTPGLTFLLFICEKVFLRCKFSKKSPCLVSMVEVLAESYASVSAVKGVSAFTEGPCLRKARDANGVIQA